MPKRTQTSVTVAMAAILFLAGAGIAAYQGWEGDREKAAVLTERWTGTLEDVNSNDATASMPEDDGCASVIGRDEWPEEMSQAVSDGTRPGHGDDSVPSEATQADDSVPSDGANTQEPISSGTDGEGVASPSAGTGHDRDGGTSDLTCPRPRDYSKRPCPEL